MRLNGPYTREYEGKIVDASGETFVSVSVYDRRMTTEERELVEVQRADVIVAALNLAYAVQQLNAATYPE